MQTLRQTLERTADLTIWRRWAIVFLAGVVVLVSTACATTQAAAPPRTAPAVSPIAAPISPLTPDQPDETESMYPYKDTDMDTRAADAKADRMIREANQRIQQGSDKPLGQRAEAIGQSAKQSAENIGQSTQRAAKNAQQDLDQLGKTARGVVNDAADRIDQITPGE